MPQSEPNALPTLFENWNDWRATYDIYEAEYLASKRMCADKLQLKIRLMRLGFVGPSLETEVRHVEEQ